MTSTTYINSKPVRMIDHWYRLNDVLTALGFCKAYASWVAKHIDDEHKTRIGPKTQEAWHVSFEGLKQWSKTSPHWFDAKRRQRLVDYLERRCVFCGQKMLGEANKLTWRTSAARRLPPSTKLAGQNAGPSQSPTSGVADRAKNSCSLVNILGVGLLSLLYLTRLSSIIGCAPPPKEVFSQRFWRNFFGFFEDSIAKTPRSLPL